MSDMILKAEFIVKSYPQGNSRLEILKSASIEIQQGEAVCIVGSSGAGKSTLMHILGTLDRPDRGEVYYKNQKLFAMSDEELAHFRNKKMGFVFQFHHLMTEFTAVENVMLPAQVAGLDKVKARARAMELLQQMKLADRAEHFPNQLSGGELQRVAIARALVNQPEILFADEPTGNLDSQNAQSIQDMFFDLKEKMGLTLVIVTHDPVFAQRFPRVLKMKDGSFIV